MTPEQLQRVDELFGELLPLSSSERETALSSVEDPEVAAELKSLLGYAAKGTLHIGAAIEGVVHAASVSGAFRVAAATGSGTRFGHYRIERHLGYGGMGDVYEAVRDDDFHKRVALKIVRYGLNSEYANRRFQQERQVLAGLEHPNIARLLDGGEAQWGEPYLVLEYVEGVPIDRFCDGKPRATVLRLFLKVCDAVEYAHRNLVVHRDLKPANILVTADGEPKLLDFGIAKLIDAGADVTQTGFSALTPQYASPEQVRGEPITTASDIYSLGMVLYELLRGKKPYTLSSASPLEIDRIVCQTELAPPGISEDLDNILLMALRKDAARRYRSVREFADDIERSLKHLPVLARPDSAGYRVRKFVRRRWREVSAGGALFFAIGVGIATTQYQARVAQQRFDQVRKLAHSFVFDYNDELAALDGTTSLREKMVRTALEYLDNLSGSAGNDIGFQKELASAYQKVGDAQGFPSRPSLGHTDQAIASYRKAAAIHDQIMKKDPSHRREAGAFYVDFAGLLGLTGHYDESIKMVEAARNDLEQAAKEHPLDDSIQRDLAHSWCLLGDLDEDRYHSSAALLKFRKCDAIMRAPVERSRSFDNLRQRQQALERVGTAATGGGHLNEALAAFDEEQTILDEMIRMQPANPNLRRSLALLAQFRASVYYEDATPSLDDQRRCLEYSQEYLATTRQMVDKDPNDTSAQRSYATALYRESVPLKFIDPRAAVGNAKESVRTFDDLIAGGKRSFLFLSRRARAQRRLSEALLFDKQTDAARAAAEEALKGQREAARDPHDLQETTLLALALVTAARAAEAQHDRSSALKYLNEAELVSAAAFAQGNTELTILMPYSIVLEELAGYWTSMGDDTQSQKSLDEARGLWRSYPDQNEFVQRESARLAGVSLHRTQNGSHRLIAVK
jgi:hypothetical protein